MEMLASSIGQIIGCSCCCLLFVLVVAAVAALALRGKKAPPDEIDGIAPAPGRGSKATASLTKMESAAPTPVAKPKAAKVPTYPEAEEAGEGQTVVISRPSSPSPSPTVDPAASAINPMPIAGKPRAVPPPPPRAAPPPMPGGSPPAVPNAAPPSVPPPVPKPPADVPPPRAFVPGRTIVVEDPEDVPMPPPIKKV
jgi:hypothetical protein